jgi:hypothetical protein
MPSSGGEVTDDTVFLLSGGLGTRLGAITEQLPKAMVPVLGKPFIDYKLQEIASQGIAKVVLCVGHFSNQIIDFVNDGSRWGLKVEYSIETNNLLGTGGALAKALRTNEVEDFYVAYADSLLFFDYKELTHLTGNHEAVMAVFKPRSSNLICNVEWNSNQPWAQYFQNPRNSLQYMDYGVTKIKSLGFLEFALGKQDFSLGEYFEFISPSRALFGVEAKVPFQEIGSFSGLAQTEKYLGGKLK